MMCVVCKVGRTSPGATTVTLEREGAVLVVKGVPAEICGNCGEAYVDDRTTEAILHDAEEAVRAGVRVHISEYGARPQVGARDDNG